MAPRPVALLLSVLLVLAAGNQVSCECDNVTYISSQVDLLLAEYDRGVGDTSSMKVSAAMEVQHASINERDSTIRLLASLYLKWEDKRLAWNATSWGCDNALVSSERLWLPDVAVLSAATAGSTGGDMGLRARLTSDGRVSWAVHHDLTAPITLSLDDWPKDKQEAVFKFGSRSYSENELNLTLSDSEYTTVFESGAWELLSVNRFSKRSLRLDKAQQILEWRVTLRRRAAAHSLAVAAVLAAAMLLLIAAAMLPPASRPALCATATLVASLWLISALVRLPGAASVPLLMSLLCAVSIAGAVAALSAAVVLRVARCSSPPPHALRTLVISMSSFCKLIPPEGSSAEWSAWAAAAQLLDYVLLALVLFTLFVIMCLSF